VFKCCCDFLPGMLVFVLSRWFGGVNDVRRIAAVVMDVSSKYLPLVLIGGRGGRPVRDVIVFS